MNRNFNQWLSTFKDNIATWTYYTDFNKVYSNVDNIKVELNILNSLIGSTDIENEFKNILIDYPKTLKAIPILIAKRENEIKITDATQNYVFNFNKPNYSVEEYATFMRKTGLFDLLENHIIHSLVDYVMGVEVGMDTNGRKNRTGDAMEDLVETYLQQAGLVKNVNYFKEMTTTEIKRHWNIDLSAIVSTEKLEKRFDFVVKTETTIYGIETNFYSGGGSKLNETARSYYKIAEKSKLIPNFEFVWFTDGIGWNSAKYNLEETFEIMEHIYSISDLENGIAKVIFR